jgi:hypothetical protein
VFLGPALVIFDAVDAPVKGHFAAAVALFSIIIFVVNSEQ